MFIFFIEQYNYIVYTVGMIYIHKKVKIYEVNDI